MYAHNINTKMPISAIFRTLASFIYTHLLLPVTHTFAISDKESFFFLYATAEKDPPHEEDEAIEPAVSAPVHAMEPAVSAVEGAGADGWLNIAKFTAATGFIFILLINVVFVFLYMLYIYIYIKTFKKMRFQKCINLLHKLT